MPPNAITKTDNHIKFIKGFFWNFMLKISLLEILLIVKYVSEKKPVFIDENRFSQEKKYLEDYNIKTDLNEDKSSIFSEPSELDVNKLDKIYSKKIPFGYAGISVNSALTPLISLNKSSSMVSMLIVILFNPAS